MALPWLAVLLTLICCSMTTDHAISDPDPPIKNLRIDPERKRLAWDQHGNVSEIGCYVNSKILKKAIEKPYCSLGDLSCEVKNYTVKVIKGQPFSAWIQYPKQGNPLAAADNLTCRVHDVDQLSCSWAVGEEAPANVQYHFYLKHPLKTWPCPKYMQNQQGVNVQCHFDSLSLQPERQTLFRFLVNGTSGGSKIPCRQMTHRLEEIEILAAPNITKKWCNESYSFMEWEVRSLFTEDIKYELEIQKGTDLAYKEETELKVLGLRNPGPYTVKIKAMDSLFFGSRPEGQWSAPQHLGQNTGVGCHSFLQGNLPDPGTQPGSPAWQAHSVRQAPSGGQWRGQRVGTGILATREGFPRGPGSGRRWLMSAGCIALLGAPLCPPPRREAAVRPRPTFPARPFFRRLRPQGRVLPDLAGIPAGPARGAAPGGARLPVSQVAVDAEALPACPSRERPRRRQLSEREDDGLGPRAAEPGGVPGGPRAGVGGNVNLMQPGLRFSTGSRAHSRPGWTQTFAAHLRMGRPGAPDRGFAFVLISQIKGFLTCHGHPGGGGHPAMPHSPLDTPNAHCVGWPVNGCISHFVCVSRSFPLLSPLNHLIELGTHTHVPTPPAARLNLWDRGR